MTQRTTKIKAGTSQSDPSIITERNWLDALLDEYDDFDLPSACPFGEEDYGKDAEQDDGDLSMEDTSVFEKSLGIAVEKPTDETPKPTTTLYKPIDETYKTTNVVYMPTDKTYKPIDEAYKQTNATHFTPTDRSTDRPTGVQFEQPKVHSPTLTTATTSGARKVPTPDAVPISLAQVAEPANYHGHIAPEPAIVAHTIYPDPHILRQAALPISHPSANLDAIYIPSLARQDQKQNPAVLPPVQPKEHASKQPLLAPVDYGVPCEECKEQSIWQPGAARCFDCLGNSPSARKRQEVIARALIGIWSCTNCYKEADNGAGKHCQLCSQRQVAKNVRAKHRKAAGETWVPDYVQKGGVKKEKVAKPKGASLASRKAKIAAMKKGLGKE